MKWKANKTIDKYVHVPKIGDKKVKEIFLWLPFETDGFWYWLETVEMEYTYTCYFSGIIYPMSEFKWVKTKIVAP